MSVRMAIDRCKEPDHMNAKSRYRSATRGVMARCRLRLPGRGFVAALLLLGVLAALVPSAVSATTGYNSVSNATINPLLEGGYRVAVDAYATYDPSIGVVAAPDPSIDWGDGSSSNATYQVCSTRTVTSGVTI